MRVALIVNPVAGRQLRRDGVERGRADIARTFFRARGIDAGVVLTERPGHAAELARRLVDEGVDRVIAWGGDGTINEVAGPLLGTRCVLGIVPGGSGDGLAGGLGVPRDSHAALAAALDGAIVRVDVGRMGPRHFLNAAGVGFDAAVAHAFGRHRSRRRGLAGYVAAGLRSVASYRPSNYTLDLDGIVLTGPRFMVALANCREYGNGFVLAPEADPSDGCLDAVVVDDASIFRQLWRARRLLVSPGAPEPGIQRIRIRRGRIAAAGVMTAHVDGEAFEAAEALDVSVEPGALRLALSPKAAGG